MSDTAFALPGASVQPSRGPDERRRESYAFGGFEVEVGSRTLRRHGDVVDLGGRAFDLLTVLLRARGTVVSKKRIMEEVWPSTLVDDSNLRFQMSCLRRVLRPFGDIIKTVQGRGYVLVAEGMAATSHHGRSPSCAAPTGEAFPISPALIAVVEDDESTREALEGLLQSSGYVVDTFGSPQALGDVTDARRFDCLILDVWMPGQNGLDFHDALRAAGLDMPVIFMSGHADVPMAVRAMKSGACEFLTKPVRHQDLLLAIDAAVTRPGQWTGRMS